MKTTIDADRLIARIMRLSGGRLTAQWNAAGIVKVIEEERAENVSLIALKTDAEYDNMTP